MTTSARKSITQLAAESITPTLQPAGFRRRDLTYRRRRAPLTQVVNIQSSTSNVGERGRFYVNVSLHFDQICALEGRTVPDAPKEYECHVRYRMERIVLHAPAWWEFETALESGRHAAPLRDACGRLLIELDRIDSPARFLESVWLLPKSDLGVRAQMHWLLGETENALRIFRELQVQSQARPTWHFDEWVDMHGLAALRELAEQDVR